MYMPDSAIVCTHSAWVVTVLKNVKKYSEPGILGILFSNFILSKQNTSH